MISEDKWYIDLDEMEQFDEEIDDIMADEFEDWEEENEDDSE